MTDTAGAVEASDRPRAWWIDYLPEGREATVFVLVMLVSAVGLGLFLSGSVLYYTTIIGLSNAQVGTGLAVAAVAGLLCVVPIGAFADRFGARNTLVALMVWRGAWFAALAVVDGPVGFVVAAVGLAVAEGATPPAVQSLVGTITQGADRTRTMAIVRMVRNVGLSVGAGLAALLVGQGGASPFRVMVLCTAAAFVLAAVLLVGLRIPRQPSRTPIAPWKVARELDDWRFLAVALLNGGLALHMTILAVGIPLWVVAVGDLPTFLVPLAIILNTVMAVALQVQFSKGVEGPERAVRALRRGGSSLALCAVAFAFMDVTSVSVAVVLLVLGTVLLTFAELWQSTGGWELSFQLARGDRRTLDLATFNLGVSAQGILGPPLLVLVVAGGVAGWLAFAVVAVVLMFLTGPAAAAAGRHRGGAALPEEIHRSR